MECCAGQIYYLLWSPDGKEIGELSVFLEGVLVTSIIIMREMCFMSHSNDEAHVHAIH
jgi:hypothetical protein